MQLKENYKLIKIAPLDIDSVFINDLNDFLEVFNNSNEIFIYGERRLEEKMYFSKNLCKEKEINYYFYFFKEGFCYGFNSKGYKILEDLLDARKYDLKAVLNELLPSEEINNEIYFYPVYYSFKNSGCYPDFDYWQTIQKFGFGLQNWNQCWPETLNEYESKEILSKDDYEEAKQAGFLKFEKESGVKWLDAKRIGILNLEDYELFVSISKFFYGRDQSNYRRQRELDKTEFDEIKALGFDRNDLEEVLKSKFLENDPSDYYHRNEKQLTLNSIKSYMKWKEDNNKAKSLGFESYEAYCDADTFGIDDPEFYLEYKNSGLDIKSFKKKKHDEIIIPNLIGKKFEIFINAWKEALEKYKTAEWEFFTLKAFIAVENGIDSLITMEYQITDTEYKENFRATSKNNRDPLIEDKIESLIGKGYTFPDNKEITYIRRLRNDISHQNEKIDDKEAKQVYLLFKEIVREIQKIKVTELNPLSEDEISELRSKIDKIKA